MINKKGLNRIAEGSPVERWYPLFERDEDCLSHAEMLSDSK
jgi:hypothetical protein